MGMETTKGSRRGKERTRKSEAATDRERDRVLGRKKKFSSCHFLSNNEGED